MGFWRCWRIPTGPPEIIVGSTSISQYLGHANAIKEISHLKKKSLPGPGQIWDPLIYYGILLS